MRGTAHAWGPACGRREGCLVNFRHAGPIFMLRGVPAPGTWQFCRKFSFEAIWGMLSPWDAE